MNVNDLKTNTQNFVGDIEDFMASASEANPYIAGSLARGNFKTSAFFYILDRAALESNEVDARTQPLEKRLAQSEARMNFWGSHSTPPTTQTPEELARSVVDGFLKVREVDEEAEKAAAEKATATMIEMGFLKADQLASKAGNVLKEMFPDIDVEKMSVGVEDTTAEERAAIRKVVDNSYVDYVRAIQRSLESNLCKDDVEIPGWVATRFFERAYDSLLGTPVETEHGGIVFRTAVSSTYEGYDSIFQNRWKRYESAKIPRVKTEALADLKLIKALAERAENEAVRVQNILDNGQQAEFRGDNHENNYGPGDSEGVLHKDETGLDTTQHGEGSAPSSAV